MQNAKCKMTEGIAKGDDFNPICEANTTIMHYAFNKQSVKLKLIKHKMWFLLD